MLYAARLALPRSATILLHFVRRNVTDVDMTIGLA